MIMTMSHLLLGQSLSYESIAWLPQQYACTTPLALRVLRNMYNTRPVDRYNSSNKSICQFMKLLQTITYLCEGIWYCIIHVL